MKDESPCSETGSSACVEKGSKNSSHSEVKLPRQLTLEIGIKVSGSADAMNDTETGEGRRETDDIHIRGYEGNLLP